MTPDYELIIRKEGSGWHLLFIQGDINIEVTLTSLDQIEEFLKQNCEGYNDNGS